jgi:hypothetical protein
VRVLSGTTTSAGIANAGSTRAASNPPRGAMVFCDVDDLEVHRRLLDKGAPVKSPTERARRPLALSVS